MPRTLTLRRAAALLAATAATAAALPAGAVPLFQEIPNAFGAQPCGPSKTGCFTNYLRLSDIDLDGDLDVLFPNADGYFQKGAQIEPFVVYENDATAGFTDVSASAVGGFTGYLRQIAIGDVNGDGAPDIYAPSAWADPDAFFINDGAGVFSDESAARLPGVQSRAGAARFGDVDNDGDLDLLVGDGWAQAAPLIAHLYLNDGAGVFTDATRNLPATPGSQPIDFDLLDADGDFDIDLFINMHTGRSSLWRNDGAGVFTDITSGVPDQSNLHYGPVACDVDADGDLDIWADNAGPNLREQLLINDGAGAFADESAARVTGNIGGADDNGLVCVDIDGDGDWDAVIMSLSNVERVLVNDGTGHFTAMNDAFPQINDSTLWLDMGDLNGDGRLDVVTGQGESGSWENRVYLGNSSVPVDTFPPRFRAVETLSGVPADASPVVRFAVTDDVTTDDGPRLQRAFVRVTTPDSMIEVGARFVGGDLFRAELPAQPDGAEVSYTACAVDVRGNEGCAETKSYVVGASGTGGAGGGSTSTGTSTGSGQGAAAGGPVIEDEGCGCAVPGSPGRAAGALALGALAMALAWRRRRAAQDDAAD